MAWKFLPGKYCLNLKIIFSIPEMEIHQADQHLVRRLILHQEKSELYLLDILSNLTKKAIYLKIVALVPNLDISIQMQVQIIPRRI